jgi:putative methionine-R-sulfoxide reductase with GAF domain
MHAHASSHSHERDDPLPQVTASSPKTIRERHLLRHTPAPPRATPRPETSSEENDMLNRAFSAIPEMETFDQDELNNNPILNAAKPMPPIGALLVAEGLITREQLNASLLVQEQDHPNMPIGELLVRSGYIVQDALDTVLGMQREIKQSLVETIAGETEAPPQADLTALVLHRRGCELAYAVLRQLGVAATPTRNWAEFGAALNTTPFDLIVLGAEMLNETAKLPDHGSTPLLILPTVAVDSSSSFHIPQWSKTLIARFVGQVRHQRYQHDLAERLQQRDYELSTVASLTRSMAAASSPPDALVRLMITIRDLFGIEAGTLYRLDRAASQLIFEVVIGPHQETLYQQRLPIDRGLAGWVVRNVEPLLIPDVRRDPRFEGMFDNKSGFQTRSILCVPLVVRGEVCGVIQLINKLSGEFNERDLQLLRILAALGSLVEMADTWLYERDLGT